MKEHRSVIEAVGSPEQVRSGYNFRSYFYPLLVDPLLRKPRRRGLGLARLRPNDKVLEVGVGRGRNLLEIARRLAPGTRVYGVDLSPKMVMAARRLLAENGFGSADIREADARKLSFPAETFDVVYSSYVLDILPLEDIRRVLVEFRRVMKPGARLVLVNCSKERPTQRTWRERTYEWLPASWVPYVHGGSRPVFLRELVAEAGLAGVTREFVHHVIPSEVVTARKPTPGAGEIY